MIQFCEIYRTGGQGLLWELSPYIAKELNLTEKCLATLKCGSLSVKADVKISDEQIKTKKSMGLSGEALTALKIPPNICPTIKPIDVKEFRLGPLVGILTFPHVIKKNQLNRYIKYAGSMEKTGLLYVFRPSDIHPQTQTVTGLHYNQFKKIWEFGEFPYPDVVMDRMYPNNYKAHFELEKVIGQNKIFNKKTLISKTEFNEVLKKDSSLRGFIPETKLFSGAEDLDSYLREYNGVFLKPVDSMRGRGIIYVTPVGNELLCTYMDGGTVAEEKIPRADDIFEILGRLNQPGRPYIIQGAVNCMKFMERAFSFRAMAVKDGSGLWSIPIIAVKAARPEAFLTNTSSGAEYILVKEIMEWIKQQLSGKNIDLLKDLTQLSLRVAEALDNEFGPLGKLGIDIVIDKSGKPWLIEANGNPGVIFREGQKEYPDWHWQVYVYPLLYAFYLAGFSKSAGGKSKVKNHFESQT